MTENEQKVKEDVIYHNLLYSLRISLGETHEREEIEECMTYIYPEHLRRKARVLAYDFGEVERYEEGIKNESSKKKTTNPIAWFLLMFFSIVLGVSFAVLLTMAFFNM